MSLDLDEPLMEDLLRVLFTIWVRARVSVRVVVSPVPDSPIRPCE